MSLCPFNNNINSTDDEKWKARDSCKRFLAITHHIKLPFQSIYLRISCRLNLLQCQFNPFPFHLHDCCCCCFHSTPPTSFASTTSVIMRHQVQLNPEQGRQVEALDPIKICTNINIQRATGNIHPRLFLFLLSPPTRNGTVEPRIPL